MRVGQTAPAESSRACAGKNKGETSSSDATLSWFGELGYLIEYGPDIVPDVAVSDTGLKQLGGLQRLEYLDLMGTKVTDDGLEYLVGLGRLRFLRLVDTPITDAGLKHLMAMSDLRELEIQDTTVTEQGAAELQQALPKLKITLGDLSE